MGGVWLKPEPRRTCHGRHKLGKTSPSETRHSCHWCRRCHTVAKGAIGAIQLLSNWARAEQGSKRVLPLWLASLTSPCACQQRTKPSKHTLCARYTQKQINIHKYTHTHMQIVPNIPDPKDIKNSSEAFSQFRYLVSPFDHKSYCTTTTQISGEKNMLVPTGPTCFWLAHNCIFLRYWR